MNRNLDILRAIAVLLVVVCHLLESAGIESVGWIVIPRLGLNGVLFFFVHTSLVLMLSMQRQSMTYWQFIIRRVFRIYPLSILLVSFYYFSAIPDLVYNEGVLSPAKFVSNLLLVQNLTGARSMPIVLWSLPFEMQMYLLLPLLFVFCTSLPRTFVAWGIAAALALAQRFTIGVRPEIFAFMPCFIPGVMAFVAFKRERFLSASFWIPLLACFVLIFPLMRFPGANWLLCLALGLALPFFREMSPNLLTKCSEYVARYSYGIYMTHMLAIYVAFGLFTDYPVAVRIAVFTSLFIALPVLLYHAIEEPFVKLGKSITTPALRSHAAAVRT